MWLAIGEVRIGVIEPETKLRLAPNVTFRSLGEGEGTVVVDTKTGELYSCNQTAAALLEAIDGRRTFEAIIDVVHGTWASVIALFHGLPFVLLGAAVLVSRRYPAWVGWSAT